MRNIKRAALVLSVALGSAGISVSAHAAQWPVAQLTFPSIQSTAPVPQENLEALPLAALKAELGYQEQETLPVLEPKLPSVVQKQAPSQVLHQKVKDDDVFGEPPPSTLSFIASTPGTPANSPISNAALRVLTALDQLHLAQFQNEGLVAAQKAWSDAKDELAFLITSGDMFHAATLAAEWDDNPRTLVVFYALTAIGSRYRYANESYKGGFDCSGLTMWAWSSAGVSLPHYSNFQGRLSRERGDLQLADVLYRPGHVMLYIGAGMIVHAANSESGIKVDDTGRYRRAIDPLA